jgi:mono/diheme cytochrome c family protein
MRSARVRSSISSGLLGTTSIMRVRTAFRLIAVLGILAVAVAYALTIPAVLPPAALAARTADPANGEYVFNIGGCANCHATAGQKDRLRLGGGYAIKSPFGSFKAPNISSDPVRGIGNWTEPEFVNAMLRGVGRGGEHLFPSFPYTSYQRMSLDDVRDLFAFLKTVPPDPRLSEAHDLSFPFDNRRAVGLWKLLFVDGKALTADPTQSAEFNRGAYLVEGPGHCAECHSSRNALGGIAAGNRFAGGVDPARRDWVPNITPHADGLSTWTIADHVSLLETGLTPDGVPVGGGMSDVVAGTAKLTPADRQAMATYLRALPARPGRKPPKQ